MKKGSLNRDKVEVGKRNNKILLWIIGSIVLITLIIFIVNFTSGGEMSSTDSGANPSNNQPSYNKVCRSVEVPYYEQETYTESEPYQQEIPLQYQKQGTRSETCSDFGNYKECYYTSVMNIDTIGGVFKVDCSFRTLKRNLEDSQSLYIKPGDTQEFKCVADVDIGEDVEGSYIVTPPTKTETRYRDVTKTRTITKYRTEQQCE